MADRSVPSLDGCFKGIAYNAEFQGSHGISLHGTDGSRWFLGDDRTRTLLHPADLAAVMEFGQLDVIAEQARLDAEAGTAAQPQAA